MVVALRDEGDKQPNESQKAILSIVDRDGLKEIVDDLELEDIDRWSTEEMRSALSRACRARPEVLHGVTV